MITYLAMKKIIESGAYDKEDVKGKLDVFLAFSRITRAQYEELMSRIGD